MDNRGIDTDPGWINRQLRELRQAIESLRSERRGAATEISKGDLTLSGGALLLAKHTTGANAVVLGTRDYGNGFIITGFFLTDESGGLIFEAVRDYSSGSRIKGVSANAYFENPASGGIVGHSTGYLGASTVVDGGTGSVKIRSDSPVTIRSDQTLTLDGGSTSPIKLYTSGTTSASPNLHRGIANDLLVVTSSRRYKQDIADHDIDPPAVLKMRVRTWRDRAEVEKDADTTQRYIGFIAEELHDLGLAEFVSYDEQGRPDAVAYDRIPAALLIALRWLTKQVQGERARTDALEAQVAAQQRQIDDLAAKVAALTPPTTPTLRST